MGDYILLPSKLYLFSNDKGAEKVSNGAFTIPRHILKFGKDGLQYLAIWTKRVRKLWVKEHCDGSLIEVDRDEFIFNALMLGVDVDCFIVNPICDKTLEITESDYIINLREPHLLREIIKDGLIKMKHPMKSKVLKEIDKMGSRSLFEINDQLKSDLILRTFSKGFLDISSTLSEGLGVEDDQFEKSEMTRSHVLSCVESWESRHDEWVRYFLADAIESKAKTMKEIKDDLKKALLGDWKISLGFFLNRTTYQSRKDTLNEKTANYLFSKVVNNKYYHPNDTLDDLVTNVTMEKLSGYVTHVRLKQDVMRLESLCEYLKNSENKNITDIVIDHIANGKDVYRFLTSFDYIGDKTASFYLKFLSWALDLDIEPIVIDRHVIGSLNNYGIMAGDSKAEAKNVIVKLAKELKLTPTQVETALYEESWLNSNTR